MKSNLVTLRALEPSDVDVLYRWENDLENWEVSHTIIPFSKHLLSKYIDSVQDIHTDRQLRLIVENNEDQGPIGCIDLFDFDPIHNRAGLGILIASTEDRGKGMATAALELVIAYAKDTLRLNQLYCNITSDNERSIRLFEQAGFTLVGVKKAWVRSGKGYKDEGLYQLLF